MSFPTTEDGLIKAGYSPPANNKPARCSSCKAEIEWWRTPKGKNIPLDSGTLVPHWSTCPNAADFRK